MPFFGGGRAFRVVAERALLRKAKRRD